MNPNLEQIADGAACPAALYGLSIFALTLMVIHAALTPTLLTVEAMLIVAVPVGIVAGIAVYQILGWAVAACSRLPAWLLHGR